MTPTNTMDYMPPKPPAPKEAVNMINSQAKQANSTFLPPFLAQAANSVVDALRPPLCKVIS